tara:strand:- start:1371 stop:1883 length:513 start_codon:yes stop_codon:yes gene_type:complete
MKLNKNLILIGMMASGKSTIGRLLGKRLNIKFFDTDFVIEKKSKMKITEIFEKKGENKFRNLEKKIALNLINNKQSIISLGGGAYLNKKIRDAANKKCNTIWLNWNSKTIIDRINKKKIKRPVALNLNDNELKNLIINRSKLYSKAQYKINCENMTKTEIIEKIIKILNL